MTDLLDDLWVRCACCERPTHDTDDNNDPLQRRVQVSGAYVLCARCEAVAREEADHG